MTHKEWDPTIEVEPVVLYPLTGMNRATRRAVRKHKHDLMLPGTMIPARRNA